MSAYIPVIELLTVLLDRCYVQQMLCSINQTFLCAAAHFAAGRQRHKELPMVKDSML